jgi:hypothetical protein
MARPQVADGGDGVHIWRVAANILKNSRRQPTGGDLAAWGLGGGQTTHHRNNSDLLRNVSDSLRPGWILWQNDLSTEKWV